MMRRSTVVLPITLSHHHVVLMERRPFHRSSLGVRSHKEKDLQEGLGSAVLGKLFEMGKESPNTKQSSQGGDQQQQQSGADSNWRGWASGGGTTHQSSQQQAAGAQMESEASYRYIQPLACPGGNRMTSRGVRSLMKVNSGGQLKTLGQRFVLNLKLTHQIVSHLDKYIGGSGSDTAADTMHTRSSFASNGPGESGAPKTKHQRNQDRWNNRIRQNAASDDAFDDIVQNSFKVAGLGGGLGMSDGGGIGTADGRHHQQQQRQTASLGISHRVLVELGPGPGALSRSLLTRKSCGVLGIELDMRFNPYLQRLHQNTGGRFQWLNADALEADEMTSVSSQFPSFMELKRAQWARRLGELQELHFPNTKPAFLGQDVDNNEEDSHNHGDDASHKNGYYGGYFAGGGGVSSQEDAAGMFASAGRRDGDLRAQTGRKTDILSRRKHMGLINNASSNDPTTTRKSPTDASSKHTRALLPAERSKVIQMAWEATDSNATGAVVSLTTSPLIVFANLPFSVASEMLVRYAMDAHSKTGIYEMGRTPLFVFVQKEVADRLVATPLVSVSEEINRGVTSDGSSTLHSKYGARVVASRLKGSNYSRPSVFIQNYFTVKIERIFSEETYYPKTEVLGALVHLRPRPRPLVDVKPASLFAFLNASFKGRMRGPSRPALKSLSKICPPEVARFMLESLRIDGNSVPLAQLSVTDLATLALLWETYITKQRMGTTSTADDDDDDTSTTDKHGDDTAASTDSAPNYEKYYATSHDPLGSQGAAQRFFDDEDEDEGAGDDIAAVDHTSSVFSGEDMDDDLSNTIDLTGLMEEDGGGSSNTTSTPGINKGQRSATTSSAEADSQDTEEGNGEDDPSSLYGELSTSNVHLHAQEELRRLKALREAQLSRRRR